MASRTHDVKRPDLRKQLFSGEAKNTPGKKLDEEDWLVPNWDRWTRGRCMLL